MEIIKGSKISHIKIGDPLYFEKKQGLFLTFDEDLHNATVTKAKIQHDEESGEYEIIIAGASRDAICDTYLAGREYQNTECSSTKLGCDTARFILNIGNKELTFHTGADGYYGTLIKYKNGFGFVLYIYLDDSIFTEDELIRDIKYLIT